MKVHFGKKTSLLILFLVCFTSYGIAEQDHSFLITNYQGAKTCEQCHPGKIAELQQTTHYKFESALPDNYLYDHEGNVEETEASGKLWKLCGFPTTFAQFNWMGQLKNDPLTPHVDVTGGCARCHIGIGIKPFTAVGQLEPQANEANNIDCLMCHADDYDRKLYVATVNGEPELKADGSPYVFTVPRADGVFDFSVYLDAAKTVGSEPKADYCLRCHAAAGGGKFVRDNMEYNFKRGAAFDPENDVHAANGMSCADCHSAGNHQVKRPLNNDLYAYDNVVDHEMCTDCHTATPHENNPMYNDHTEFIACTTCHAQSIGGAVYKDFSKIIPADPNDPLAINQVEVRLGGDEFNLAFAWFNGTVTHEIEPLGSRDDGKIYPYKETVVNQPVDANGNIIPVKWGKIFVAGDLEAAMEIGTQSYADFYTEELAARVGLPPVPGEFDHFQESDCIGFSISHGITKEKALSCGCCHAEQSYLDFEALGYNAEESTTLKSFSSSADCARPLTTDINLWDAYE